LELTFWPVAKPPEPETVFQRALQVYEATNPYEAAHEQLGLHGMSTVERTAYINSQYIAPGAAERLSKKAQKELWKQVNEANTPPRKLPKPTPESWGKDRYSRNLGDYTTDQFEDREDKEFHLVALQIESQSFKTSRYRALNKFKNFLTGEPCTLEEGDVEAERKRRKEMAALKEDLYGEKMGQYSTDPDWDDVVPIPQVEPEGALASIAYPEDYAECVLPVVPLLGWLC
jgi:protein farnesyltransferase/geranylgeranyltransferase type-1 subunit alpha